MQINENKGNSEDLENEQWAPELCRIRHGSQLKERIIQTGIVRERQPGSMATIIVHTLLYRHP